MLTIDEIRNYLPHGDPFIFVDEINEIIYGELVEGIKFVKNNEFWVSGHFPEMPVFPGVLMIETIGQICSFIFWDDQSGIQNNGMLIKVINFKFIQQVTIGDIIVVKGIKKNAFANYVQITGHAYVKNKLVATGDLLLYFEKPKK